MAKRTNGRTVQFATAKWFASWRAQRYQDGVRRVG